MTTKNFVTSENKLVKARIKDMIKVSEIGEIIYYPGVEQLKIDGKWVNRDGLPGAYIKTKTLLVTRVDHSTQVKKSFKEGKRYQVKMNASLASNAGYIYDEDGDGWQLFREDIGFSAGFGVYEFEAQYK
jgi:uncharacterized protein (DUF4415 family)